LISLLSILSIIPQVGLSNLKCREPLQNIINAKDLNSKQRLALQEVVNGNYNVVILSRRKNGKDQIVVILGERHENLEMEDTQLGQKVLDVFPDRGLEGVNSPNYWFSGKLIPTALKTESDPNFRGANHLAEYEILNKEQIRELVSYVETGKLTKQELLERTEKLVLLQKSGSLKKGKYVQLSYFDWSRIFKELRERLQETGIEHADKKVGISFQKREEKHSEVRNYPLETGHKPSKIENLSLLMYSIAEKLQGTRNPKVAFGVVATIWVRIIVSYSRTS